MFFLMILMFWTSGDGCPGFQSHTLSPAGNVLMGLSLVLN